MTRILPGPKPGTLVRHVPECFDNASDAAPVVFWIRAPSNADRRALVHDPTNPGEWEFDDEKKTKPTVAFRRRWLPWREKLLSDFVVKVEGYTMDGGVPIPDGAHLAKYAEEEFLSEAYLAVMRLFYLSADESKSSAKPQDSPSQATWPSDGTATTAKPTDSTSTAIADPPSPTRDSSTPHHAPS